MLLLTAVALPLSSASGQTPANAGVLLSEFHYGPAGSGAQVPTFIEIMNISQAQPVNISGWRIGVTNGFANAISLGFPNGTFLPPMGLAILARAPLPSPPPPNVPVAIDPSFFSNISILQPGVQQVLCLVTGSTPTANLVDSVTFNGGGLLSVCGGLIGTSFRGPPLGNNFGQVNRVLYVDSNTSYDFDPGAAGSPPSAPTPGLLNADLDHINGFIFGASPTAAVGGEPIPPSNIPTPLIGLAGMPAFVGGINPGVAVGNLGLSIRCTAVDTPNHPRFQRITDPDFDPVIFNPATPTISANVNISGQVFAQDALLGGMSLPGGQTFTMVKPPDGPGGQPGVLQIPMAPMTEARRIITQGQVNPGRPRIQRILTDFSSTDSGASGTGDLSKVQIDVLPGSTGGGDIWCDVIVYDENGFAYRAKVRNWPNQPAGCTTPLLGMGSPSVGRLDLIALCYTPQPTNRELFILPTLNPAPGPFFGITPDAVTLGFLLAPLVTHPAHVQTTVDGIYAYTLTSPGLSGILFTAVAVEFDPSAGFVSPSPVASITVL